jgi:tetratricopeptide (TPR) repeat protein
VLNNLANVLSLQGRFERAIPYLMRSLGIATEKGSKEQMAEALSLLAEARSGQKLLDQANEAAQQAVALAAEIGSRLIEGQALRTLAKIAREQGNRSIAETHIRRALSILSELKNPSEIAKTQFQLALLQRDNEQLGDARATLEQATLTFERLGAQAEYRQASAELKRLDESVTAITSVR